MSTPDIGRTYGAMLIGGSVAIMLSGALLIQVIIYFRLYAQDSWKNKIMVLFVWFLDMAHSTFILFSLFDYLINFFGDSSRVDHIPWSIAVTIVITAIQTLVAHCFFVSKIHDSSDKNWWITVPILVLVLSRLGAASVSTSEMIRLQQFSAFTHHYPGWVFTTGLSLSCAVDVIITVLMCFFLRRLRRQLDVPTRMIQVIDSLTLWTVENGLLTCLTTTASLICWLTMPTNLVFLGLHFVIAKLYANSLLGSLNTRKELREMRRKLRQWGDFPVLSDDDFYTHAPIRRSRPARNPLEVNIERTVERTMEERRSNVSLNRYPTVLEWKRASDYRV